MIVGIPKEIKNNESRVGITEIGVKMLVERGHKVLVEKDAGLASGISNENYIASGAQISDNINIYKSSDMIVKVKEPQPSEYDLLKENQILYCYLHLANEPELTKKLVEKGVTSVAYETIEDANGKAKLLVPMSEVAGKMATQIGAQLLQKNFGGKGILLGGSVGVKKSKVVIIGAGVVGTNALKIAIGMGADVTVLDIDRDKLEYLDHIFEGRIHTLYSNHRNIAYSTKTADLLIGAVLLIGHKAPKLVTKEMIRSMSQGSVVVDVCVDQGGCVETCTPTDHENPTFTYADVIHYCVPNMPGIAPRTSTYGLTDATLEYMLMLADHGIEKAGDIDHLLIKGINTYHRCVTYEPVATALSMEYNSYTELLACDRPRFYG